MICKKDITDLKTDIGEMIGQKIVVRGSLGRSKSFEKEATIEKAYPNLFVIKYNENNRNVTYSYTDVLTRTVEIDVIDGNVATPLIPPQVEELKKGGGISRCEFCGFSAQRSIGFGRIQKKYGGNGTKDPYELGDIHTIGDAGNTLQ